MTAHRKATLGVLVGTAPLLLTALAAGPAHAHGAPTDPVSRAAACAPQNGRTAQSAACKAAVRVRGGQAFGDWDNLRVANVRGRDRQTIPDGKLCSGGIGTFAGLDLPRSDWPATRMTGGRTFTLTYRSTIPHKGTFKLYLTKAGYTPGHPLRWSDLDARPFATADDPALQGDAYRIKATLPADRSGRHVIYTIWQNTDTPDTYYSCSDVVITGSAAPGTGSGGGPKESEASKKPPGSGSTGASKAPASPEPSEETGYEQAPGSVPSAAPEGTVGLSEPVPAGSSRRGGESDTLPLAAGAGATILAVAAAIAAATLRRRRS